jgi:hypothetical protein
LICRLPLLICFTQLPSPITELDHSPSNHHIISKTLPHTSDPPSHWLFLLALSNTLQPSGNCAASSSFLAPYQQPSVACTGSYIPTCPYLNRPETGHNTSRSAVSVFAGVGSESRGILRLRFYKVSLRLILRMARPRSSALRISSPS